MKSLALEKNIIDKSCATYLMI